MTSPHKARFFRPELLVTQGQVVRPPTRPIEEVISYFRGSPPQKPLLF